VAACNISTEEPRGAVITFLRAVETLDTAVMLRGITLEAAYSTIPDTGLEYAGTSADTVMVARLIKELLPGGALHARWTQQRMVVGNAVLLSNDSALVEITRLNQETGARVYNKFGIVNQNGLWQIYSFKTQVGPAL
jgi:hypothetical protein